MKIISKEEQVCVKPSKSLASSLNTLVLVFWVLGEKAIRVGDDDNKNVYERRIVKILRPGPLRSIEMHP